MDRRDFLKSLLLSLGGTAVLSTDTEGETKAEGAKKKIKMIGGLPIDFHFKIDEEGIFKIVENKTGKEIGGIVNLKWDIGAGKLIACNMDIEFYLTALDILPL